MKGNEKDRTCTVFFYSYSKKCRPITVILMYIFKENYLKNLSRTPLTQNPVPNLPLLHFFPRPNYQTFPFYFSPFHLSLLPCSPVYPHLNISHHSKTLSPPSLHSKTPFYYHLFLLNSPPLTRKKERIRVDHRDCICLQTILT